MAKPDQITPRTVQLNFRVSEAERDAFMAAAARADLGISDWLRMVLGAASGRSELTQALRRAEREQRRLAKAPAA